jgi:hypothetical protein
MKNIYFTLLFLFSVLMAAAQLPDPEGSYNPFLAEGIISPAPLLPLELNGVGVCSFKVGNTGNDALPYIDDASAMKLTISLGLGVPDVPVLNATTALDALGGSFKDMFNWTYNVDTKTYSAVQKVTIPALDLVNNTNAGKITIQYRVAQNSSQGISGNGFNVNITPPPYSMTSNSPDDDNVSSYTWTEYLDFGDAPLSYGIASHSIDFENYLGTVYDGETGALTSAAADGDDNDNLDDEDGVVIPPLVQGTTVTVSVTATGLGYVNGWIDWNGDGDFLDAGERIINGVSVSDDTRNFSVTVPWTANSSAPTFARFRYAFTPRYTDPSGAVEGGEVEDYQVQVVCVPPAAPLATVTQPTCEVPTGTLTVTSPIGATLEYSLDGSTGWQTSAVFAGLLPDDTYTVYVRDNTRELTCTASASFVVDPVPDAPATPLATVTQPTCALPTGYIVITAPTGVGLEYSIDGTNWQTPVTFAALAPGDYTVSARNTSNPTCVSSALFTINEVPAGPDAPTLTVTQPTCSMPSGTITITAPVGPGYTYFIDGDLSFTNPVLTNLAPGSWSVTVVDADGCVSEATLAVINPIPDVPATPEVFVIQPTCEVATGAIGILGPPPGEETYSINGVDYIPNFLFTDLNPGTYTVTAMDGAGCVSAPNIVVILPQPVTPVAPTVAVTQPGCFNTSGTITVTAPVATGYTYSINGIDYQAGVDFAGVAPGTYTVTVKSDGGCVSAPSLATVDNQLPPAEKPVLSLTQPTCEVSTGTIEITSPLSENEYSIDGVTYTYGKTEFTGLVPGTYTVTVRNSYGCISEATVAVITAAPGTPETPVVAITQPTCDEAMGILTVTSPVGPRYLYSIDGTTYTSTTVFMVAPGSYNVTVGEIDGCLSAPYVAIVNPQPPIPVAPSLALTQPGCIVRTGTLTVLSPTGTGFTYSIDGSTYGASAEFSGLVPGTYSVTVKNAEGCTSAVTEAYINPAPEIPEIPTVNVTQPGCDTPRGIIEVLTPSGQFEYSITGSAWQTSTEFTEVTPGTYSVTVRNGDGCVSEPQVVTILPQPITPDQPRIRLDQPTCDVATGSILIYSPLGTDLSYSLDGLTYTTSVTFTELEAGTYTLTVKSTAGCVSPGTVFTVDPQPETPAAPVLTLTQPSCEVATGSILITAPLGDDLRYSIDGEVFQSETLFTGLIPGSYEVIVENGFTCSSSTTAIIVEQPGAPTQPVAIVTQPDCDLALGSILITQPMGDGLSYSIDGVTFTGTLSYTDLAAGTYTVTAANAAGCLSAPLMVTILPQPEVPVAPKLEVTQPDCLVLTGTIEVTSPLGMYYYSVDGTTYTTSTTFTGLVPGNYSVTVMAGPEGCVSEATGTLINLPPPPIQPGPTVTVTNPDCSQLTGMITITEPTDDGYTYSIDGMTYTSTTLFEGVAPGDYQVSFKTGEGCVSVPVSVTVNEPPVIPTPVLNVTQPTCAVPTGTIEVTSPLVDEYVFVFQTSSVTTLFTTNPVLSELQPGTYTVTVDYNEICQSESVVVTLYPPVEPVADAGPDKELGCSVTEVVLEGFSETDGVSFSWEGPGIVSGGDTATPTVNAGGTYTLTVTHIMSQCTATDVVEVTAGGVPPVLVLSDTYCVYLTADGKWTLNSFDIAQITAGSTSGSGSWSDLSFTFSRRTFECRDAYPPYAKVTVTATDAGGCAVSGTFNLTVLDTIAPVAKCRNITVELDAFGQALVVPGFVNDGGDRENVPEWAKYYKDLEGGSYDNCGIAEMYLTKSIFTRDDVGPNQVVLTVIDPSGNIAECEATVTVVDPFEEEAGVPGDGGEEGGEDPEVILPNTAPTLADVTDIEVMNQALQLDVLLTGISAGSEIDQKVKVTAVTDNPSVVTGIAVIYTQGSTGQLLVTVAPGMSGEAWITVTVKDDGGTANGGVDMIQKKFKVKVTHSGEEVTIGITDPDGEEVVTATIDLAVEMGFKLYPNPTRGRVNIEMTGTGIRDTEVSVYTIQGTELFRKLYKAGEQINLNLSPYVAGVYMVRTQTEGATFLRKVILEK